MKKNEWICLLILKNGFLRLTCFKDMLQHAAVVGQNDSLENKWICVATLCWLQLEHYNAELHLVPTRVHTGTDSGYSDCAID